MGINKTLLIHRSFVKKFQRIHTHTHTHTQSQETKSCTKSTVFLYTRNKPS